MVIASWIFIFLTAFKKIGFELITASSAALLILKTTLSSSFPNPIFFNLSKIDFASGGTGNSQSFKDLKKAAKKVSSKLVLSEKNNLSFSEEDASKALKEFNLLAIVITDNSLSEDDWLKVDETAEWFSKLEDDGTSLYNFWEATNGLGSLSISY